MYIAVNVYNNPSTPMRDENLLALLADQVSLAGTSNMQVSHVHVKYQV
eukprot:SAG22_NODE_1043_length_5882_cov_148.833132_11_plen_48_part_00